jgi:alkaline phosphatase D
MDRRSFFGHSGFFVIASALGPLAAPTQAGSDEDDDEGDERLGHRGRRAYPQGVASGDPKADSVVFWTRCLRTDPKRAAEPLRLRLQVALDPGFERVIAHVRLVARPEWDHTVRAKIRGLPPGRTLYYRFRSGGDTSPVGRTRTAPAPGASPALLKFAWFTCQDWSVNHWGAMSLLAAEDLDFVVHVGDYVYETVGASFQAGRAEPAHGPIVFPDGTTLADGSRAATTLADYRTLYRTYRGDQRLQARQDAPVFASRALAADRRVISIATSFKVPFFAQHRRKEAGVTQETCQPEDAPTNRIAVLMVTQDGWTDGCNPLRCWYARRTCNRRRAARSAASP